MIVFRNISCTDLIQEVIRCFRVYICSYEKESFSRMLRVKFASYFVPIIIHVEFIQPHN